MFCKGLQIRRGLLSSISCSGFLKVKLTQASLKFSNFIETAESQKIDHEKFEVYPYIDIDDFNELW